MEKRFRKNNDSPEKDMTTISRNIASVLNRKYPFELNSKPAKEGLFAAVVVFFLLYFLQPFGINEYDGNKFLVCLAFGLVTFICCLVLDCLIIAPIQKHAKTWRIWHEVMTVFVEIVILGICNFLMACILFRYPLKLAACLDMIWFTIVIGLIYTVLSTSFSYQMYMRSRLDALLEKTAHQQEGVSVTLQDHRVRGTDLSLPLNDLLYIEAQKNNVAVFFVRDGNLNRMEIQSTLASVLNSLKDYPNIFQCHRSFVVNLNSITSAKGNSNGYTLELGGGLATVPVSRSFVSKLKSFVS